LKNLFSLRTQQRVQKENKDLQAENAKLKGIIADTDRVIEHHQTSYNGAVANLFRVCQSNNSLRSENDKLKIELADSDSSRRVSAEGLALEREELLNRAKRIAMRIRGLGFDPETL
jgi:regulator of replication initiation timing